ncbi:MAG TPA: hypothetical protein VIV59_07360 [Anaeromyxobacteraceae bacterium]
MNQAMEGLPPAAPPLALAAAADPCADVSQPPAALETAARVLKIADVALEGAAKIADKLCGQTVVAVAAGFGGGGGGNTSAVCTVIETASAIATGASTVVEIALEFLRDDMQAATFACLQDTIAKVGKVQATVEASGAALLHEIAGARAALEAQTAAAEQRVRSDIEAARDPSDSRFTRTGISRRRSAASRAPSARRPQSRYFHVFAPSSSRMRTSRSISGSKRRAFTPMRLAGVRRELSQWVTQPQRAQRTNLIRRSPHRYALVAPRSCSTRTVPAL